MTARAGRRHLIRDAVRLRYYYVHLADTGQAGYYPTAPTATLLKPLASPVSCVDEAPRHALHVSTDDAQAPTPCPGEATSAARAARAEPGNG